MSSKGERICACRSSHPRRDEVMIVLAVSRGAKPSLREIGAIPGTPVA